MYKGIKPCYMCPESDLPERRVLGTKSVRDLWDKRKELFGEGSTIDCLVANHRGKVSKSNCWDKIKFRDKLYLVTDVVDNLVELRDSDHQPYAASIRKAVKRGKIVFYLRSIKQKSL